MGVKRRRLTFFFSLLAFVFETSGLEAIFGHERAWMLGILRVHNLVFLSSLF